MLKFFYIFVRIQHSAPVLPFKSIWNRDSLAPLKGLMRPCINENAKYRRPPQVKSDLWGGNGLFRVIRRGNSLGAKMTSGNNTNIGLWWPKKLHLMPSVLGCF